MIEPGGARNASAPAGTTERHVSPYLTRPSTGASMKDVWSMATIRIRPSSLSRRCIFRFIGAVSLLGASVVGREWPSGLDDDAVGARLDGVLHRRLQRAERVA